MNDRSSAPSAPLRLQIGDTVRLRRVHPCGGRDWRIVRVGADIGLVCFQCGRRVQLSREDLERRCVSVTAPAGGVAAENAIEEAATRDRD